MIHTLKDCLENRNGNSLLPFFWQHHVLDEQSLRAMVGRINDLGMSELCVESRPHPDFGGPGWWHDLGIILDEAQKRNMRVWVLDDRQFPTGFAAGLIRDRYPERGLRQLNYYAIDVMGPDENASFLIDSLLKDPFDSVEAVLLGKRLDEGADWEKASSELTGIIDVTDEVSDGTLWHAIPEGLYTVIVVVSTIDTRIPLLNPISKCAVQTQIEGVYEPHLKHCGALFGKTFAGFFSDEPQFANGPWHCLPGMDVQYPFSDELRDRLKARFGMGYRRMLANLWFGADAMTRPFRYAYMDCAAALFRDIFSKTLGDWCHEHHLLYIGHQVEDNNSHSRLGSGAGHFFRAQAYQDYAGMDIVMHQIHPGYAGVSRHWHSRHTLTDGEFFHYLLAKLCSSAAHINPRQRGRALCENFGAYGWMEGVRLMKWLADHCLVRGINAFTPHAFTDSAFPEWDSPPHFYAQGNNPQYRFMGRLFRYMNRMCWIFSGGEMAADVMLLYQADAEWYGEAMLSQTPARVLMQHQIDFDVVPCDAFEREFGRGYRYLVIPRARALPRVFRDRLYALRQSGVSILFVDGKPIEYVDGTPETDWPGEVVAAEDLPRRIDSRTVRVDRPMPMLRAMHYRQRDAVYLMLMNESKDETLTFRAEVPFAGPYGVYDGMDNVLYRLDDEQGAVTLTLYPGQSLVITGGPETRNCAEWISLTRRVSDIDAEWTVSTADAHEYPAFRPYTVLRELRDLNGANDLPRFSGTFRYEARVTVERPEGLVLRLNGVFEAVRVLVNGREIGERVAEPYLFDVEKALRSGENTLVIEVTNTLAKQVRDYSSAIVPQEPGGMLRKPEWLRRV